MEQEVQLINTRELAKQWSLPESWLRERTRRRTEDRIPHLKMGRYVLFEFGSASLTEWLNKHRTGAKR